MMSTSLINYLVIYQQNFLASSYNVTDLKLFVNMEQLLLWKMKREKHVLDLWLLLMTDECGNGIGKTS